MKMDSFYTLNAVLHGGSFAAAAKEMNLSPSAVSLQMKRLEEYFGQPLFDRSALVVRPTPLALDIRDKMNGALQGIEGLRRRSTPEVRGEVRVGVADSMQAAILPATMHYIKDHYPGLIVRPLRGRSVELTEAVKQGKIDAAIVVDPEGGGARRLNWYRLLQQKMVLIAPPDTAQSSVSLLLKKHDLIRFERNTNMGRLAARYLSASKIDVRGNIELQSTHAVVAMVSMGLGVAIIFLPDKRLTQGFPVREIPLGPNAPSMGIAMASRIADADSRIIQVLQHAFKRAALRLTGENL